MDLMAVDAWIAELAHSDPSVRARAAERLGGSGAGDAVPALVRALGDDSFLVRIFAVKALGALGEIAAPAVGALIAALDDEALQIHAIDALGAIGAASQSALQRIRALADSGSFAVREAGSMAAFRIDGDAGFAVTRLESILSSEADPTTRTLAAAHLGEIGAPGSVAPLTAALADPSASLRRQAAHALGRIGPGALAARPALERALHDREDDAVRLNAATALALIARSAAGLPVLRALLARGGEVRLGDEEGILERTKTAADRVRAANALAALGALARPALPDLYACLDDDSDEVRAAARAALETLRTARG